MQVTAPVVGGSARSFIAASLSAGFEPASPGIPGVVPLDHGERFVRRGRPRRRSSHCSPPVAVTVAVRTPNSEVRQSAIASTSYDAEIVSRAVNLTSTSVARGRKPTSVIASTVVTQSTPARTPRAAVVRSSAVPRGTRTETSATTVRVHWICLMMLPARFERASPPRKGGRIVRYPTGAGAGWEGAYFGFRRGSVRAEIRESLTSGGDGRRLRWRTPGVRQRCLSWGWRRRRAPATAHQPRGATAACRGFDSPTTIRTWGSGSKAPRVWPATPWDWGADRTTGEPIRQCERRVQHGPELHTARAFRDGVGRHSAPPATMAYATSGRSGQRYRNLPRPSHPSRWSGAGSRWPRTPLFGRSRKPDASLANCEARIRREWWVLVDMACSGRMTCFRVYPVLLGVG